MLLFFFQAEDGIRDDLVTGVQTCALPISTRTIAGPSPAAASAASRSVKMVTAAPGKHFCSAQLILSLMSGFAVPASPAPTAVIAARSSLASRSARSALSSIARTALSTPIRDGFDGPAYVRARTWSAEFINTHSVFVPPPSKPRMYRMETEYPPNAYAQHIVKCHGAHKYVILL